MLETRRRDDLEDPADGVAGVPERVPLVTWFEGEVALLGVHHIVAEQRSQPTLQDVAVLVLLGVAVNRGGEGSRWDRVLDERESAARLLAPHDESGSDRSELDRLAVPWSDDARTL